MQRLDKINFFVVANVVAKLISEVRIKILNFSGIIIGIFAFIITGIFHPIVVKSEYYFTEKIWPLFLILGIISAFLSLIIQNHTLSGIFGILSFVLLWCIRELKEQTKRVEKGWFPKNPKRKS